MSIVLYVSDLMSRYVSMLHNRGRFKTCEVRQNKCYDSPRAETACQKEL